MKTTKFLSIVLTLIFVFTITEINSQELFYEIQMGMSKEKVITKLQKNPSLSFIDSNKDEIIFNVKIQEDEYKIKYLLFREIIFGVEVISLNYYSDKKKIKNDINKLLSLTSEFYKPFINKNISFSKIQNGNSKLIRLSKNKKNEIGAAFFIHKKNNKYFISLKIL